MVLYIAAVKIKNPASAVKSCIEAVTKHRPPGAAPLPPLRPLALDPQFAVMAALKVAPALRLYTAALPIQKPAAQIESRQPANARLNPRP